MTVRGNDVHHFAGNPVLVSECDAAEWMPYLLPEFTLNHFAGGVFVVLERFAHVGEERAGDEIIALNGNTAAERFLQHIRDGDALPRTRIEMLDESHVDVAGQQGELDRAKFVESPALAAAAHGDGFAPHGRDPFAQRLVLDPSQAGKKLRDVRDAIAGSLSCCHGSHLRFSRYFCGFEEVRSIVFLASKSSLTVSPYQ